MEEVDFDDDVWNQGPAPSFRDSNFDHDVVEEIIEDDVDEEVVYEDEEDDDPWEDEEVVEIGDCGEILSSVESGPEIVHAIAIEIDFGMGWERRDKERWGQKDVFCVHGRDDFVRPHERDGVVFIAEKTRKEIQKQIFALFLDDRFQITKSLASCFFSFP